jgi:hypothetical protein
MDKEQVEEKAKETVTLSRGTVWMLRIAAATGLASFLSHGLQLLHQMGIL